MAKLSARQQRFCDEYLIDLNGKQAAIRAGYSPNTAEQAASRLLRNVKVSDEIDREMAERSKRTGINQDRVLLEIAKMAFVNMGDLIDIKTGAVKEDASREDLSCIQNIKYRLTETDVGKSVEYEVRIADKKANLELLGKHLGMFKDKIELEADMELNINIDYGDENK